jgi:hypothetical protein
VPVTVAGDAEALRRALENLLENACVHGAGEVTVSLTREAGVAVLAVSDEGPASRRRISTTPSSASGAARTRSGAPAPASGWRSCAPPWSGTAAPSPRKVRPCGSRIPATAVPAAPTAAPARA